MISTSLLFLYGIRFVFSLEVAEESFHYDSVCHEGCAATAMLDGNSGSSWNAFGGEKGLVAWATFDFGAPVRISGFDISSAGDTTHDTKDFTLEGSENVGGPFTLIYDDIAAEGTKAVQHFDIDPNTQPTNGFQYVRLKLVTTYSGWQAYVREVDFQYEEVEVCANVVCGAGFLCDVDDGACARNCDLFDIDGFLTDCSQVFAASQSALATEITNRQNGDDGLQSAIDDEVSEREGAVTTLEQAISDGDGPLQTAIDDEVSAREAADVALGQEISDEVSAREAADSALETAMNNAGSANQQVIQDIQNDIGDINYRLEGFVPESKRGAAYAVGENSDDEHGTFVQLWVSFKDIIIVFLLVSNFILMGYVYCSKRGTRSYDKVSLVERYTDSEANLVS